MDELLKKLLAGEEFKEADYRGTPVKLNEPFLTPDDKMDFATYAENSAGDIVRVRFDAMPDGSSGVGLRCDMQKDRSTPAYWMCKMVGDVAVTDHAFQAIAVFDMASKTLTSVRDGVQEYMGVELGIEPASKIFTIYRSPETISAIMGAMDGISIIEDHIDVDAVPTEAQTIGLIDETEIIACVDAATDSTCQLSNAVKVGSAVLKLIDGGKKQLSLGYTAKVREHKEYNFEQYDIVPRHLAIVDSARGGSGLTFKDGENGMGKILVDSLKAFIDAEGFSAKRLLGLLKQIQDNIENLDGAEFKKVISAIEKAVGIAEGATEGELEGDDLEPDVEPMTDPEMVLDADPEKKDEEKVMDMKDAKFVDAVTVAATAIAKEHVAVIAKAKTILPETFDFADKTPNELMVACLKEDGHEDEFKDSDLALAFKMIKPVEDKYKNFGDAKTDDVWNKEI